MYPASGPGTPTSLVVAYSSMAIGRWLSPRLDSSERYAATCAAMLPAPPSSCQAMMSGTVPLAFASVRKVLIEDALNPEKLGPWIGRVESFERTSLNVVAQPLSKLPAAEVFQVQSGSFHSSY